MTLPIKLNGEIDWGNLTYKPTETRRMFEEIAAHEYARGVADERERCLDICAQHASIEGIHNRIADAIQKGEGEAK